MVPPRRFPLRVLPRLAALLLATLLVAAPVGRQREPPRQVFRTGINTVPVTATVTDENGRLLTGLTRDDFIVLEDNVEQKITQFTSERVPVSLGLLVDVSESMRGRRMIDARSALDRFLAELLHPDDEAFVAVFNHASKVIAPWTIEPRRLERALTGVEPTGGTALYDALASTIPLFAEREHQRAALVIISDGADTASDRTVNEVRGLLRRSDAFVYAVAIDAEPLTRASTRVNPYTLRAITDDSGGYTEIVRDSSDLAPATARIADELNHQYLMGYTSTRPPDGSYRSIRVKLKGREGRVRARRGYIAEK